MRTAWAKLMPCALATWAMRSRDPCDALVAGGLLGLLGGLDFAEIDAQQLRARCHHQLGIDQASRNSAFSLAIDSVSPITTESVGMIAQSDRPAAGRLQPLCMSSRKAMPSALVACVQKIMSAQRRRAIAAARRGAGLQDHRPALRAARDRHRAARPHIGADMVGVADLGRVGEHAALAIEHHGVIVPAIPQGEAGLHHVVGAVVAIVLGRNASMPQFRAS